MTRVLVVKLSSFGDVIHTFPAITDLKRARPDVEVDWLVEESYAPLVSRHPAVSQVHPVALRRLRWPPTRWPRLLAHRRALRRTLREQGYDLVIDAQGLVKSALLARLARAPVTGFDRASAREPAAVRFYTRTLPLGGHTHIVDQLRRFFAQALDYPEPAAPGEAGLRLPERGVAERYGLLVTGAGWPTKLWAEKHWRVLAEGLVASSRRLVLPWGNGEERKRVERIAAGLAGARVPDRRLSVDELVTLAANADFAIGLDTGLSHLAAAFGVPSVTLFGPTDAKHLRPYGRGQRTIASTFAEAPCERVRCAREPSGHCCMDRIAVDAVWVEVSAILAQAAAAT